MHLLVRIAKIALTEDGEVVAVVSCLAHPGPPEGTKDTAESFPLCSDFKEGRLAGGRRALGTLPRLCMPCLRVCVLFCCCFSEGSPFKQNYFFNICIFYNMSYNKLINEWLNSPCSP